MVRTAIQLQMFENMPESLPKTIKRIGETPLDGVELYGLAGTPPPTIADSLEDAGLDVVGAHVPIGQLDHDYEDVVETYETIGCSRLILPLYDADAFASIADVEAFARHLSTLGARLTDDGFDLLYHNHSFEFSRFEDGTAYDSLIQTVDGVDFELDTGLAMYGGADPISLLSRYEGRMPLVHLTDSVPGNETTIQVELGAGRLDVTRCVETAHNAGVEWIVYEHGLTSDPLGSLMHAATKLPMLSHGKETFADGMSATTVIDDANSISKDAF